MNSIKNLSACALAGQKIITGFDCKVLDDKTRKFFSDVKPGGIILFKRNIQDSAQLKKLNFDILNFFKDIKLPAPFISIDQEGGIVSRMKKPFFEELEGIDTIFTEEDAKNHASKMAALLKKHGINMNMAPVLDISDLEPDSIMKKRTFKGNAIKVSILGAKMIKTYMDNNIIPVGKHFPGIGGTKIDSHLFLPEYEKEISSMEKNDLVPFAKAFKSQLPALMFSHVLYKKLDDKWPASLSVEVCRELLRKKMGFNKVTMTDDLDMKAVKSDIKTSALKIMEADMDIALICHNFDNVYKIHEIFTKEIENNNNNLLISIKRIFNLKKKFLAE
ncbi:MAG: beta-N-acetylhexosaminidase [Deltaproteobacteria bacterium]|nr:MAG: beta-N-acetylhexosaminidase [Deltaproteobacteria bacterium]